MKCSTCSNQVKPVVIGDIDGTLANYHDTFSNFACAYWSKPRPVDQWRGKGEFEDHLGLTKAEYREAKLAFRQGGMKRNLPVYPGAREFTQKIYNLNAELWLVTQRPWMLHDSIDRDTQWWLDTKGIMYTNLIYSEDKFGAVIERLDPDTVVMALDDLPEMYDSAELWFPGAAVQVARPHNSSRACMRPVRADNLLAAQLMAIRRIVEWERKYD